jgi:hypothetical protein
VGAGGLALLAQLRGLSLERISQDCDNAMDQLLESTLNPPEFPTNSQGIQPRKV